MVTGRKVNSVLGLRDCIGFSETEDGGEIVVEEDVEVESHTRSVRPEESH